MKNLRFARLALVGLMFSSAWTLQAQWQQNATTGPSDYNDPANWYGGVVNNLFTNDPLTGLEITFSQPTTLSGTLTMAWPGKANVTFRSDSATPRTITLTGGFVKTNNTGGIVTVGTVANPLVLDLNGATRQLGGQSQLGTGDGTNYMYAKIVDSSGNTNGVNLSGSRIYTYLLNDENSFVGPVSFVALRGGGFSSIKNIGAGPSAMGAPTDTANGTVSVADNTSIGSVAYLGTGDTTDRTFLWNTTSSTFSFENRGSGEVTFTGPWRLNPAKSNAFTVNPLSAPIELGGYVYGATNILIVKCTRDNTNRVTLSGLTNTFMGLELTNALLVYTSITNAGYPSSLGTNAVIVHQGNTGTSASQNRSGQGASLQYVGPSASHDRTIKIAGPGYNWGINNGTTSNSVLTFTSDLVGASTAGGANPRYIHLGAYNTAAMEFQGVIPNVTPGMHTTVVIENAVGMAIFNGGTVSLLNPANTFSGGIQIKYARTARVMTLADSGVACSIGTGDLMPGGTTGIDAPITLGSLDSGRGGNLSYVGTTAATCNRGIRLVGSVSGSPGFGLYNDSTNGSSLSLTGPVTIHDNITNLTLRLGGSASATNVLTEALGNTLSGAANLSVLGSVWKLNANHSYAGHTAITNGTLLIEGSVGGSGVDAGVGGVLGGNGSVGTDVTVAAGGTIAPGIGIGRLTLMGSLTNNGTFSAELSKADGTNDVIACSGTVALGGQLAVTNLAGTLALNDTFKLFEATTFVGQFTSVSPATPGPGLAWDISGLPITGTLKIVAGITERPKITSVSYSGTNMTVSGTGGNADGTYYVVTSPDLNVPIASWTRFSTNSFAADGAFSFVIPVNSATPQAFFRLQLQLP